MVDQFGGQPVEQLRVRRLAAVEAEVAGRLDQPGAEVSLPEPVDDHPGEQRIARVGRSSRPVVDGARLRGVGGEAEVGVGPGHGRQRPRPRRLARLTRIAPKLNVRRPRLARSDRIGLVRIAPASAASQRRRSPQPHRARSSRSSAGRAADDLGLVDEVAERSRPRPRPRNRRGPGRRAAPARSVPASIRLPPAGACRRPKSDPAWPAVKIDRTRSSIRASHKAGRRGRPDRAVGRVGDRDVDGSAVRLGSRPARRRSASARKPSLPAIQRPALLLAEDDRVEAAAVEP